MKTPGTPIPQVRTADWMKAGIAQNVAQAAGPDIAMLGASAFNPFPMPGSSVLGALGRTLSADITDLDRRKKETDTKLAGMDLALKGSLANLKGAIQAEGDRPEGMVPEMKSPITNLEAGGLAAVALIAGSLGADPNDVAQFLGGFMQSRQVGAEREYRNEAMKADAASRAAERKSRAGIQIAQIDYEHLSNVKAGLEKQSAEYERKGLQFLMGANDDAATLLRSATKDNFRTIIQSLSLIRERYNAGARLAGLPEMSDAQFQAHVQAVVDQGLDHYMRAFQGQANLISNNLVKNLKLKGPSALAEAKQAWGNLVASIPGEASEELRKMMLSLEPDFQGVVSYAGGEILSKKLADSLGQLANDIDRGLYHSVGENGEIVNKFTPEEFDRVLQGYFVDAQPWIEALGADSELVSALIDRTSIMAKSMFSSGTAPILSKLFGLFEDKMRLRWGAENQKMARGRYEMSVAEHFNRVAQMQFDNKVKILRLEMDMQRPLGFSERDKMVLNDLYKQLGAARGDAQRMKSKVAEMRAFYESVTDDAPYAQYGGREAYGRYISRFEAEAESLENQAGLLQESIDTRMANMGAGTKGGGVGGQWWNPLENFGLPPAEPELRTARPEINRGMSRAEVLAGRGGAQTNRGMSRADVLADRGGAKRDISKVVGRGFARNDLRSPAIRPRAGSKELHPKQVWFKENSKRFASMTAEDVAHYAATRLRDKHGIKDTRVLQAILANMYAESGFDPTAPGDNGNSWGLIQANRAGGMGKGHRIEDLMNPDYIIDKVLVSSGVFKQFLDYAKKNPKMTARELTYHFARIVERPAKEHLDTRRTAYDQLFGGRK